MNISDFIDDTGTKYYLQNETDVTNISDFIKDIGTKYYLQNETDVFEKKMFKKQKIG